MRVQPRRRPSAAAERAHSGMRDARRVFPVGRARRSSETRAAGLMRARRSIAGGMAVIKGWPPPCTGRLAP